MKHIAFLEKNNIKSYQPFAKRWKGGILMTNSELILRLVEMLLTEKENSMKVEQEKEKKIQQKEWLLRC